jgi:hypothetical protein
MELHTREVSALMGSEGRLRDAPARSGGSHTLSSTAAQRNAQSTSATCASAEAAAALAVSWAVGPLTCDDFQSSELLAVVARSHPGFHGNATVGGRSSNELR